MDKKNVQDKKKKMSVPWKMPDNPKKGAWQSQIRAETAQTMAYSEV